MPFTFSHPAIILPLNYLPKKWISLTGLIIGSLTPDFEYFLRMRIKSNFSHTLLGIFWFDLPLGILLTFIFHNQVKNQLYKNLPKILSERFLNIKEVNWNKHFLQNWKIIIISILVGAISHIFWDGFTHHDGFFVKTIPQLSKAIEINKSSIKTFKILQHLSTLIGATTIVISICKLPKIKNFKNKINPKYWIMVILITFSIFTLNTITSENSKLIGNIIVSLITSGMIGIIIAPFFFNKEKG
ncbi:hypothetical protein BWK63_11670 [Flavobacterium covae]|uniref:DUF4184 family protein n=2 Tax=Flavobacterium covae TaxID=2906076 RepID=A0ABW8PJC4_9FLAO|nr:MULTISPECIES: DUF4184 family protein [Flavobacterium]OWP80327.1 hypothetical protein BWK63_11670 [Flavobacterium covae]POR20295.1 hypothetical protein BWK57_13255 [Flavobacterium columnare]